MKLPVLGTILDAIQKGFSWVWDEAKWIYGVIAAFVLVPINYALNLAISMLDYVNEKFIQLGTLIDSLGLSDMAGYWGASNSYLAMANAVFPINLAVVLFLALCGLWIICMIIRLIMKWVSWG